MIEKRNRKSLSLAALWLAALLGWWAWDDWVKSRAVEMIPYSAFEQHLREGRIAEVTVGDTVIAGRLKAPEDGRQAVASTLVEPQIAQRLATFDVPYRRVHSPTWLANLLQWIAPLMLIFFLWRAQARRAGGGMGGGLLGIGRSKAKVYMEKSTGVRFDDVAGVDEAKEELQEIVDFLRNPKEHGRLGARIPKGVLLMGPTGTGKTLLARAVAGEAGVVFFSISGSEFIEMFVGVGAARVRDLFEQARANAPAIIFIDELDALGKARAGFPALGGQEEREQTLNQLLVELDGFDPSVGVVLLAATNRPETLDPALLRAGRFDRQVLVDRPDRRGRAAILKVHARRITLSPSVDLEQVAAITVGFAGADLANLVNEAALAATRRKGSDVTLADFTRAIERIVAGIEKKTVLLRPQERRRVATHELGHALTALALPGADQVHKVSIVPHGIGALGYTLQRPSEDRRLLRREELLEKLAVLMGGRAAELLVFGEPSTGAADDLAKATDLARDMVLRYGMDPGVGPVAHGDRRPRFLEPSMPTLEAPAQGAGSELTARRIDAGVRRLLLDAQDRACGLLRARRAALDRCVDALMAQESLEERQLLALMAGAHEAPAQGRTAEAPPARDAMAPVATVPVPVESEAA